MRKILLSVLLICCMGVTLPSYASIPQSSTEKTTAEPKGDPKNQKFLKKINATVSDMKKHVSVDTGCPIDKIVLKELSEQLGNAIYIVDVCGKEMKYRRTGSIFFEDGKGPIGK